MWFYNLARFVCRIAFNIYYKISFEGVENIPQGGGYIVASNHQSNMDPIMLALRIKKPMSYLGKEELFKSSFFAYWFRLIDVIPVQRGSGDTSTIDRCVEAIKADKILGIFPEGTRSKDGKPQRPKSGLAAISKASEAPILPCSLYYENKKKFRSHVLIKFGEIIPYEELGFKGESPRELKIATKLIFGRILELLGVENNDGEDS